MSDKNNDKNNKTEQVIDTDMIITTTSMDKIGSMLQYMAEGEFAFSQIPQDYDATIYNGRGFLLQMLSEGLANYHANLDTNFAQAKHLQQQHEQIQTRNKLLTELKANYEKLFTISSQDTDQAKKIQQIITNLTAQLA